MDANWQSEIEGLYVAGEAAGTFGVYRPGGSALNSTQVGSLRAAEHIAKKAPQDRPMPRYELPKLTYGSADLRSIRDEMQSEMTRVAVFDRSTAEMKRLLNKATELCEGFFEIATIRDDAQIAELYRLYDMALTQRDTLSAMICSAEAIGTHGSAFVDRAPNLSDKARSTRTLTKRGVSHMENVSSMPMPELWFETLLARKKQEMNDGKGSI